MPRMSFIIFMFIKIYPTRNWQCGSLAQRQLPGEAAPGSEGSRVASRPVLATASVSCSLRELVNLILEGRKGRCADHGLKEWAHHHEAHSCPPELHFCGCNSCCTENIWEFVPRLGKRAGGWGPGHRLFMCTPRLGCLCGQEHRGIRAGTRGWGNWSTVDGRLLRHHPQGQGSSDSVHLLQKVVGQIIPIRDFIRKEMQKV